MDETERLAPHGGCWWEGCEICNTERNPYPTSWKPQNRTEELESPKMDINSLKELKLTVKQAIWLLNRNFSDDSQWTTSETGDTYQENLDLRIQIAVENTGGIRISTWDDDDIPTFESSWQAHESCPNRSVFYSNDIGWCTLHDEWWKLPDEDEILDL